MIDSAFFILSKVFWALVAPGNLLFLIVLAGIFSFLCGKTKPARWLFFISGVAMTLVAFLPVGQWLNYPLEKRFFGQGELPTNIDGIIVLGGAINAEDSYIWNQIQVNDSADRELTFIRLAREYSRAKLVYTGGSGRLLQQDLKEADIARRLLNDHNIDSSRVVFERESRNTFENAVKSISLVNPKPNETWVLITSASHMPRAVGVFCKQAWNVIPYPVDYRTSPGSGLKIKFDFASNLNTLNSSVREWIGLVAYYLTGKTSALFPSTCNS